MRWLIAANVTALALCVCLYGIRAWNEWRHWKEQKANLLRINDKMAVFSPTEADRLYEILHNMDKGWSLSDSDLDWCFFLLDAREMAHSAEASRFLEISNVLSGAVPRLSKAQREKIFLKMSSLMARDQSSDEIGIFITQPASWFRLLKDKRAIPLLQKFRRDDRQTVRYAVEETLEALSN